METSLLPKRISIDDFMRALRVLEYLEILIFSKSIYATLPLENNLDTAVVCLLSHKSFFPLSLNSLNSLLYQSYQYKIPI